MLKNKKYNLYGFVALSIFYLLAFVIDSLNIFPQANHNYTFGYFNAIEYIIIGVGLNSVLLLFFHERIFISWLKHIAWWYLLVAWILSPRLTDGFFIDIILAINILMGALFVITLIYALIMSYILKNEHVKR